jgi:23S rRNA-/tRNA-specific pseudouridylate synthase
MEEELAMEIDLVVAQHRPARVRVVLAGGGPDEPGIWRASQQVRPLEALEGATLVEVRPRTGFLHQIRASLASLGHPLAGDALYRGDTPDPTGARRHQLHASRLGYEEISVESPDPEDFLEVLAANRH